MSEYQYPQGKWKFPEHTHVTMTTREVTIFLSELGQLRQDLGKMLARIEAFEPQFKSIAEQEDRLSVLERSLENCQAACGRERSNRGKVFHWIAYAVAGLVPGAATWYLTRHLH